MPTRRNGSVAIKKWQETNEPDALDTPRPKRVELGEPFEGHNIVFDENKITYGFLEDLQSTSSIKALLDAFSSVIMASDMIPVRTDGQPTGPDDVRLWLRTFTPPRMVALNAAITGAAVTAPNA